MTRVVATFPREFEHQFFRDIDKDFFLITLLTFIVCFSITLYMTGQPVKELSAEQVKRYTEIIYRAKVSAPKAVKVTPQQTGGGEVVKEEKEEIIEEKPVTEEAKKEVREEKRAERRSHQEESREKIRAAAQGIKILAGPTRRASAAKGGSASTREALGLSAGQMGGYDVKKMVGIVGEAGKAEKVKALQKGGAISEEIGDIDIEALKKLSLEDIENMLQGSSIEINQKAITAKGGPGSKTKQRSPTAIYEVVAKNEKQVHYCYATAKRRDSSLRGRVVVEFTINPSGAVVRVRFRESDWGGNPLGAEVEKCMQNMISSWHFESIAESGGNVTGVAPFFFRD